MNERGESDSPINLQALSERLRKGGDRARPVERHYIPKADGSRRPIGIPVLKDKIVQRATVEVFNAVYEGHFKGFSDGFRPGRSQHRALDALYMGLMKRKVNWVLDADIRGCFDANYHAVPRNLPMMKRFTHAALRYWWKSLRRRSHKSHCDRERFYTRLARRRMPALRVMHPYPEHRLCVTTRALRPEAGAQCDNPARWDLCGGRRATGGPTATMTEPYFLLPRSGLQRGGPTFVVEY